MSIETTHGSAARRLFQLARARNTTARRFFNYLLVHLEMRLGRERLISRPYELCIDVTNKCNLGCPFCPTGRREHGRGKGNVSFDTFAAIVDELAPYAMSLELFNWGEPFFNPELPRLIEYAHTRGLATLISSNLSFPMQEEYARAIIRSGLTGLAASVDGADQASYEHYRRGGRFDLVMDNLRMFVRLRRELHSEFPRLCWSYLVFGHNEEQIGAARQLAAEIGLDAFTASGGLYEDPSWAPRGTYSYRYLDPHPNRCTFLWKKAVFHWDGGFASCCMGFNKHDDFDTFRPGEFKHLWNNDKFIAARRIWSDRHSPLPEGHFCVGCDKVRHYRGLPLHSKMKPAAE